jgi:CubicO group peptidase (beta-lactamase class C family)
MSKTVAALTALKLSIDKRVALDEDVTHYLKRDKAGDAAAAVRHDRRLQRARLFRLCRRCRAAGRCSDPARCEPCQFTAVVIARAPGSVRAYSGGGCQIGQVVLEDATAQPFGDLVEALVLRPPGMEHSAFWQPPKASEMAQLAIAYDRNGREVPGDWHVYPEFAAAGLWSTPSDLARLIVAMANAAKGDKTTLFGERGLGEFLTSADNLGYGLGVALAGSARHRVAMKRGNNLGFRGGLVACPGSGQGAVVMTNGDGGEPVVDAVLDALARRCKWPVRAPWPE